MYCKACGKQIEDDSAFCTMCGASQSAKKSMPPAPEEPQWKIGEIAYEQTQRAGWFSGRDEYRFWVEATGPKGTYSAGESSTVIANPAVSASWGMGMKEDKEALDALIPALIADGWLLTHRGSCTWCHTFRRRVK